VAQKASTSFSGRETAGVLGVLTKKIFFGEDHLYEVLAVVNKAGFFFFHVLTLHS
jgi:hypothetical protein